MPFKYLSANSVDYVSKTIPTAYIISQTQQIVVNIT